MFTLAWSFGRVGRAAMRPLNERAQEEAFADPGTTPSIRRALEFLAGVVRTLPPLKVMLDRPTRPPVLVWTDASYECKDPQPAKGGFVVYIPPEPGVSEQTLWAKGGVQPYVVYVSEKLPICPRHALLYRCRLGSPSTACR